MCFRRLQAQLAASGSLEYFQEVIQVAPPHVWTASVLTTAAWMGLGCLWPRFYWRPKAWHRAAKHSARGACRILVKRHRQQMPEFKPKSIACIVWAWGKLRVKEQDLLEHICKTIPGSLPQFSTRDLANVIYGLGLLGHREEAVLGLLCERLAEKLPESNGQTMANAVYALCLLRFKHRGFLTALCEQAPERVPQFKCQELSISVYSLALLRVRNERLLNSLCAAAQPRLAEFSPQNISNLVYGLGILRCSSPLPAAACHFSAGRLAHFTAQGLSNMTYALGLLRLPHGVFLKHLCAELSERAKELEPQHIGNISYALSEMGFRRCYADEIRARVPKEKTWCAA
ncbi:unnamed protein product [Effrenium voratum]|uniref:RNA-editing substrate-binding complex 6 protein domain-containing protein n=1 Tax=Effrenium voratum TaxID=2562239 RepID=A0AA36JKT8_9DINO|nr:unnamed protein product [Effrenium voratum]CAJ1419259.1 unnamed protein product [Effrenium voratum]